MVTSNSINSQNTISQALASLYSSSCDIYSFKTSINPETSISSQSLELIYQNIPCRLSYLSSSSTTSSSSIKKKDFTYSNYNPIKLFLQNDLLIDAGSIFYITNFSKTKVYKASSEPFIYSSHQEVILVPFEDY